MSARGGLAADAGGPTVVLVNPRARGGRVMELWRGLQGTETVLESLAVIAADGVEAASAALRVRLDAGLRRLVVVGGDGTLHWAVNELVRAGATAVELGVVPAGTGCDLARTLGVPRRPSDALACALGGSARPLDAIAVRRSDGGERIVVNIASAGLSGQVDEAIAALERPTRAAYLRTTLGAVRRYRPVGCAVDLDGERWYEGPLFLLAVANGRSFGQGMRIAPRADPCDGLADVVLVPRLPPWELPLRLPQLYLGAHLGSRRIRSRRARVVHLTLASPSPLDLDGEAWQAKEVEMTVRPALLQIVR